MIYEDDQNSTPYVCSGATKEEFAQFSAISWWIDGFSQVVLCFIGFTGNSIAIPILCSKKLDSVFYRLLVCLAIFDKMYLICAVLEALRSHMTLPWNAGSHTMVHAYALYPIHNIVLCCSIYVTAAIAMERYLAVCKPLEYRNRMISDRRSPWFRVFVYYIFPVVGFCILINLPKFFELEATEYLTATNLTRVEVKPTSLRLDDNYIVYYHHYTRLFVTGIIPFCSLAYCNFRIYKAVRCKRQSGGSASTSDHEAENRQAILLVLIVLMFLICNTPRIFLTLIETFSVKQFKEDYLHGCQGLPFWLLLTGSFSHLLLTFNSSVNFFLYCVMSSSFRGVIKSWFGGKKKDYQSFIQKRRRSDIVKKHRSTTLRTEINQEGVLMTSF